jgi:hypothetical protein
MELTIRPEDLQAASAALADCRARLEDAALTFARRAQADLPDIGADTADATNRAVVAAERGVQVIGDDIHRLATALAALAVHYQRVDRTAVPRR